MNILSGLYTFLLSKDTFHNIVLSLLCSFIAYLIAMLFHARFPNLAVLFFWKQFSRKLSIIPSEVKTPFDPQLRAGEWPSLLLRGEVAGLGEMLHFFRAHCKATPRILSLQNKAGFDAVKDRNLLIIGGPKYNMAAKDFLQEISSELPYQFKRLLQHDRIKTNDPELKTFVGRNANYPDYTYNFQEETQYATIIFRKNLYASGRDILFIGGLSSAATLAGITWTLSRPLHFWLQTRKQRKGFQALIKCRVIGQTQASKIELVFYQELV